jgi:hypothetical protein
VNKGEGQKAKKRILQNKNARESVLKKKGNVPF